MKRKDEGVEIMLLFVVVVGFSLGACMVNEET